MASRKMEREFKRFDKRSWMLVKELTEHAKSRGYSPGEFGAAVNYLFITTVNEMGKRGGNVGCILLRTREMIEGEDDPRMYG